MGKSCEIDKTKNKILKAGIEKQHFNSADQEYKWLLPCRQKQWKKNIIKNSTFGENDLQL